ncbi:MAG: Stealth CR1 domain-containing protein [Proteiniphilum sp.]
MQGRISPDDIDLVYLWVDGSDPKWIEKKHRITGNFFDDSEVNNKGRYVNNDELRYSLRSVEKYVPWVRKIFIVTDDQYPEWLKRDHPKIQVVDHKEILPEEALPCFNSSVIEYFLYRIPDLADRFLFANDDMFFNKPLTPSYFFDDLGLPYVRLKKQTFGKWHYRLKKLITKRLGQYISKVIEGASLVEKKFGSYYSAIPHHNVDAYVTADYGYAVEQIFQGPIRQSLKSHIRQYGDMHRSAFGYYVLAVGKGHLKLVGRKESLRLNIYKRKLMKRLRRYDPDLFCLNDSQRVSDADRATVKPFLEELFPQRSSFELSGK